MLLKESCDLGTVMEHVVFAPEVDEYHEDECAAGDDEAVSDVEILHHLGLY